MGQNQWEGALEPPTDNSMVGSHPAPATLASRFLARYWTRSLARVPPHWSLIACTERNRDRAIRDYVEMARRRIEKDAGMFADIA